MSRQSAARTGRGSVGAHVFYPRHIHRAGASGALASGGRTLLGRRSTAARDDRRWTAASTRGRSIASHRQAPTRSSHRHGQSSGGVSRPRSSGVPLPYRVTGPAIAQMIAASTTALPHRGATAAGGSRERRGENAAERSRSRFRLRLQSH